MVVKPNKFNKMFTIEELRIRLEELEKDGRGKDEVISIDYHYGQNGDILNINVKKHQTLEFVEIDFVVVPQGIEMV